MNRWTILMSPPLAQATERAERAVRFREHRRRLRDAKQANEPGRDDTQDARLAALERELEQTQVALGALTQVLLAHGVVPQEELASLLAHVDAGDDQADVATED